MRLWEHGLKSCYLVIRGSKSFFTDDVFLAPRIYVFVSKLRVKKKKKKHLRADYVRYNISFMIHLSTRHRFCFLYGKPPSDNSCSSIKK